MDGMQNESAQKKAVRPTTNRAWASGCIGGIAREASEVRQRMVNDDGTLSAHEQSVIDHKLRQVERECKEMNQMLREGDPKPPEKR